MKAVFLFLCLVFSTAEFVLAESVVKYKSAQEFVIVLKDSNKKLVNEWKETSAKMQAEIEANLSPEEKIEYKKMRAENRNPPVPAETQAFANKNQVSALGNLKIGDHFSKIEGLFQLSTNIKSQNGRKVDSMFFFDKALDTSLPQTILYVLVVMNFDKDDKLIKISHDMIKDNGLMSMVVE